MNVNAQSIARVATCTDVASVASRLLCGAAHIAWFFRQAALADIAVRERTDCEARVADHGADRVERDAGNATGIVAIDASRPHGRFLDPKLPNIWR